MNWLNTNFPNWRTMLGAVFTAIMVGLYDANVNGTLHKSTIGAIIGIAVIGYFAKDKAVTGGRIAQTVEAEQRLQPLTTKRPFPPIQTKGLGMILFALVFSGAMIFTVAACGKRVEKIVNLPPGVSEEQTQNWYKATGALAVVGDSTKAATDLLVDMNHAGEFPSGDSYQTALSVFGRISQGGIVARNLLYAEPEHFTQSTRDQIVSFATDALGQLTKLDLQPPMGATNGARAAAVPNTSRVQDQVNGLRKALQQLEAMPPPSHTDTSHVMPMVRDTWEAVAAMRRAEGLLLIGRI